MSIEDWTNDIHQGDVLDTLQRMPESSVHMAMTSPPYYGLRDYGEDGQIGLEESLDDYIRKLVDVGDELRRVLRDDGSWWLNLGDSYNTNKGLPHHHHKQKHLMPHRAAIALQEAGWIVRNDAVWAKPNPMPESVTDRLSTTFEFVFHLTPTPDYYYDLDAIREPHENTTVARANRARDPGNKLENGAPGQSPHSIVQPSDEQGGLHPAGKNPGDVFNVTTKPYPDAHFAVYPPELCEKPIKATAPPKVCSECGTPYEKEVEEIRKKAPKNGKYWDPQSQQYRSASALKRQQRTKAERAGPDTSDDTGLNSTFVIGRRTKGYSQTCDCETDATQPGIVLDPFAGAGTTCLVAKRLNRRFIGIDLNPEYVAMAQQRVGIDIDQPDLLLEEGEQTIHEFL